METRVLTCINCPLGCALSVTMEGEEIREITGNTCKRGVEYARQEILAPARMVTTTVPVQGGGTVPVKTAKPIPKDAVLDCVRMLKQVQVIAPVSAGQVVAEFMGTAIVAAKTV